MNGSANRPCEQKTFTNQNFLSFSAHGTSFYSCFITSQGRKKLNLPLALVTGDMDVIVLPAMRKAKQIFPNLEDGLK